MFVNPKKHKKKQQKYDPKKHSITLRIHKQSKVKNLQAKEECLAWMREILQFPELDAKSAFKTDCLQLLNVINIILPCKYNQTMTTEFQPMQKIKNLEEYLNGLKVAGYKNYKNFPTDDFLNVNEEEEEEEQPRKNKNTKQKNQNTFKSNPYHQNCSDQFYF